MTASAVPARLAGARTGRRVRRRPAAVPWRTALALEVLVLAISTSMIGLLDGGAWWLALVGVSTAVFAIACGARALRVPRFVVPALSAAAVVVLAWTFFGGDVVSLLLRAQASIEQQGVPAAATADLLFLVFVLGGLSALVLDAVAVALRSPAWTVFPLAAILAVPSLLLPGGISPLALLACAASYLILLRAAARDRGSGPEPGTAWGIGAAALAVALAIGVTAPGFAQVGRQGIVTAPFSLGTGVSPMIDLGQNLRRPKAVEMLTYTTSMLNPPDLRMTSLDQFTGTIWRHTPGPSEQIPATGELTPPQGLSPSVPARTFTENIRVGNVLSAWLPVPYPALKVTGLNGHWKSGSSSGTVSGIDATSRGQHYTVTAETLEPTTAQLEASGTDYPANVRRDLFVPYDAPSIIRNTAHQVTADADTPYQKAVALQSYFLDSGFSYSTQAPVKQGFDGDSMQAIADFLTVKKGYCVHFASAMAIMARLLGIPARVGIGFLPGQAESTSANGNTTYTVTTDDLHAWPELYFEQIGWVPFNPTVGRGTVPAYTDPGYGASALQPYTGPGAPDQPRRVLPRDAHAAPSTASAARGLAASPLPALLAALALAMAAVAAPGVARGVRRARRLSELTGTGGSGELAWRELADTARDLRMKRPGAETPREFAARLRARWGADPAADRALHLLRESVERERYGPAPDRASGPPIAAAVRAVRRALWDSSTLSQRVIATILPASLLRRRHPTVQVLGSPSR